MLLLLAGAAMAATPVLYLATNNTKSVIRKESQAYFKSCQCSVMEKVRVRSINKETYGYRMEVLLPRGLTVEKFEAHLKGLKQTLDCEIQSKHLYGRVVQLKLGYQPFYESMNYNDTLPCEGLDIPLFSPFGLRMLDFADETNCHLLSGGATRMGKSVFLRLVVTHLLRSMEGKIRFLLIDNKITDLNMFQGIPQITIAETIGEAKMYVEDILDVMQDRKEKLKAKKDVVDVKEYRKKYPNEPMEPIFVVIDEYGRFAEDELFQEMITEIAETAGYLDVHLVIAAQRPDASKVLNPRIKANIVTRVAFSTANEVNSKIILDLPDAAHLDMVQGRAVLLDGGRPEVVQVPYMSSEQAKALLKPYYRKDWGIFNETQGPNDSEVSKALPSFVKGPIGETGMS